MAHMAVGSRQILFADAAVPASAANDVRQVANLVDNRTGEPRRPDLPVPEQPSTVDQANGIGTTIDVRV